MFRLQCMCAVTNISDLETVLLEQKQQKRFIKSYSCCR